MSFDTPKTLRPQVLERIVFILAGPPNKGFTHGHERRWGKGGVVSFNLATGRYINHERCSFGGLLEFIQDFTQLRSERGAAAWLARHLIGGVQ
jgi:hypothetical protein